MESIKNLFTTQYKPGEVFNEQNYQNSFTYTPSTRITNLNFVYIIEKKSLDYFKKMIGLENEENMIIEEQNASAALNESPKNSDILNLSKIKALPYVIPDSTYFFMSRLLLPTDENNMQFLDKNTFSIIKRVCPEFETIQKVIYKHDNQLKVELYNPVIKVFFVNNRKIFENDINVSNYEHYLICLPVSRFISFFDFVIYLKKVAQEYYREKTEDFDEFKLLTLDGEELDKRNIALLLRSKLEYNKIELNNFSELELYDERVVIFAFNNSLMSWKIDFKIKEKKQNLKLAIEDDPYKFFCSFCKQVLKDVETKPFCVCGRIYCNEHEKNRDEEHVCEPKNCEGCQKRLEWNSELELCNCGAVFCSDDCFEENKNKHVKICPAYKRYLKTFVDQTTSEMDLEDISNKQENEGKVGFNNIGNTCYMNSALQCLVHTSILKQKFIYEKESTFINKNNPLSTKGELLNEFMSLVTKYWFTRYNSIRPSTFKYTLGKHLQTFEGYSQHDSQEFYSQLLDALHEDINMIIYKPYTQTIEGKVGDEEESIARQSWVNFLKRNNSFIIKNFFGQFRSLLECPHCDHSSLTFDPYQVISLSIPTLLKEEFLFYYYKCDKAGNLERYEIELESLDHFKDISVKEIKKRVCEVLDLDNEKHEFALCGNKMYGKVLKDNESLDILYDLKEVYFYNRPKIFLLELNDQELEIRKKNHFPIYLRINYEIFDCAKEVKNSYEFKKKYYYDYDEDKVHTRVTFLNEESKIKNLYELVFRKLYFISSLNEDPDYEKIPKNTKFFQKLWEQITENQKDKKFFYLKFNEKILDYNDDRQIKEIFTNEENIFVNVFLKIKTNTTVKLNINELMYTTTNYDAKTIKMKSTSTIKYNGEYNLEELLEKFSTTEILDQKNTWYCSKCKDHVEAKKTMKIYKLPNYLVIHLKKLKLHSQKVPLIKFPLNNLQMDQFIINKNTIRNYNIGLEEFYDNKNLDYFKKNNIELQEEEKIEEISSNDYRLYGVVNHYGGQHFGHYTSVCKVGDKWIKFDDSSAYDMDELNVVTDGAYLLFYERI